MGVQIIDQAVREAIEGLPQELWDAEESDPLRKLVRHGPEAVAHAYIFQQALEVIRGNISAERFLDKYGIHLEARHKREQGFRGTIDAMEDDGIYFPTQSGVKGRGEVYYFSHGYLMGDTTRWSPEQLEVLEVLKGIVWEERDFANPDIVDMGNLYSRKLWRSLAESFDRWKDGHDLHSDPVGPQDASVTDLGQKLIRHYSKIVV